MTDVNNYYQSGVNAQRAIALILVILTAPFWILPVAVIACVAILAAICWIAALFTRERRSGNE